MKTKNPKLNSLFSQPTKFRKNAVRLTAVLSLLICSVVLSATAPAQSSSENDLAPQTAAAVRRAQEVNAALPATDGYTVSGVLDTVYQTVFGAGGQTGKGQGAKTNAAAGTTFIVDDDMTCSGAAFMTIQAAVNAAAPGDTIQVCAGTYAETVTTNKNLTFLGPRRERRRLWFPPTPVRLAR